MSIFSLANGYELNMKKVKLCELKGSSNGNWKKLCQLGRCDWMCRIECIAKTVEKKKLHPHFYTEKNLDKNSSHPKISST